MVPVRCLNPETADVDRTSSAVGDRSALDDLVRDAGERRGRHVAKRRADLVVRLDQEAKLGHHVISKVLVALYNQGDHARLLYHVEQRTCEDNGFARLEGAKEGVAGGDVDDSEDVALSIHRFRTHLHQVHQ